jgi:hypothetical protein
VRAPAGNDANPATVPLYRSWQCVCVCVCVFFSSSVCVCVLNVYVARGFWYCVCVGFLSSHYFPPTQWMDGWMTDMLLYTHPSQKPLANEAYRRVRRDSFSLSPHPAPFLRCGFRSLFPGVVATWNSSAAVATSASSWIYTQGGVQQQQQEEGSSLQGRDGMDRPHLARFNVYKKGKEMERKMLERNFWVQS